MTQGFRVKGSWFSSQTQYSLGHIQAREVNYSKCTRPTRVGDDFALHAAMRQRPKAQLICETAPVGATYPTKGLASSYAIYIYLRPAGSIASESLSLSVYSIHIVGRSTAACLVRPPVGWRPAGRVQRAHAAAAGTLEELLKNPRKESPAKPLRRVVLTWCVCTAVQRRAAAGLVPVSEERHAAGSACGRGPRRVPQECSLDGPGPRRSSEARSGDWPAPLLDSRGNRAGKGWRRPVRSRVLTRLPRAAMGSRVARAAGGTVTGAGWNESHQSSSTMRLRATPMLSRSGATRSGQTKSVPAKGRVTAAASAPPQVAAPAPSRAARRSASSLARSASTLAASMWS